MSDHLDNDQAVEPVQDASNAFDVALMEGDPVADETRPRPWPRWRPLPPPLRATADEIVQFPAA